MKYSELKPGMKAAISKTITDEDIHQFAKISLDTNPLHLDDEYAKTTVFKGRIAHGMLGASLISACLANKLPGRGAIYLGQNLKFSSPVRIGDTITAEVTINRLRDDKHLVYLDTVVRNQDGEEVITGDAVMKHDVEVD
ncbi:MAG: MaoC family dehydratase [Spirochaetaceae bacterium]|jgi:3-hydroxybutyryl-CoA dehydratase|nr:MaoC family dehydratase [Spirochaetaceae bacterium]